MREMIIIILIHIVAVNGNTISTTTITVIIDTLLQFVLPLLL